jgi:tetratricopeptide (TPR) repeat protein
MTTTYKIFFSEKEIRRVSFQSAPSLQDLQGLFPTYFYPNSNYVLQYKDQDNDTITVSTQLEWEELNRELAQHPIKRITAVLVQPPKQPSLTESKVKESNGNEETSCKRGWKGACGGRRKFWELHRKSYELISSTDKNDILKGKECLLEMLEIIPSHRLPLYNLACADALLGNVDESLVGLRKAIEAGFLDLEHILNDKDFNSIRETQEFKEIIKELEQKLKDEPKESNCPFRNRWNNGGGRCGGRFSGERCNKRKFWWLHRKSLDLLSSTDKNDLLKGKECLLEMLEIEPNHVIALYNLACAESLLGNVEESLKILEKSIEHGYHDLEHMLNDNDFINIRDTPRFTQIINSLQQKLFSQSSNEKPEEKPEEKKPEEKPEEKKPEKENTESQQNQGSNNIKKTLLDMGIDLPDDVVDELVKLYGGIENVVSKIFSS